MGGDDDNIYVRPTTTLCKSEAGSIFLYVRGGKMISRTEEEREETNPDVVNIVTLVSKFYFPVEMKGLMVGIYQRAREDSFRKRQR